MEMKPDDQAQTLVNMKNILMWKFTPPPTYYTNVSAHNGFIMHIVQAAVWIKAVLKMNQHKFDVTKLSVFIEVEVKEFDELNFEKNVKNSKMLDSKIYSANGIWSLVTIT